MRAVCVHCGRGGRAAVQEFASTMAADADEPPVLVDGAVLVWEILRLDDAGGSAQASWVGPSR